MTGEIGKLYQDRLYGTKVLSPLALAIIDTPEFQRLAGVRQLGFADFAYRGATHTRFEHSVGTYFITRTIMRRIVQNHERLGLDHPGQYVSARFRFIPRNAELPPGLTTHQSLWRGVTEVVSAAALLHDIGHVPFGHTLEDEFAGLYGRHDSLAGPRLYEMLFNESSGLAGVFSDSIAPWLEKVSNEELRRLLYLILSWREHLEPLEDFQAILDRAIKGVHGSHGQLERLRNLRKWHAEFQKEGMFQPFMSDVVGNTICADLLDYLPRDRVNLGMELRTHTRLQRYFTIRKDPLYPDGNYRLSIMVTRKGKGGQRRDVATELLQIMRERYELVERVFYHHKKAAASAMLAKLLELAFEYGLGPRDDDLVYPAPWQGGTQRHALLPHVTHFSDSELLDYLGKVPLKSERARNLQNSLYSGLRHRRKDVYRTLLVIDRDVLNASPHSVSEFAQRLRGTKEKPSPEGRKQLERTLAKAAGAEDGEVIVYCPSPEMQSKEVDARVEIINDRVLPLSMQRESFAYHEDLAVLERYYEELWRGYIYVAPAVFESPGKCQAIVDAFCGVYGIDRIVAYKKVRTHDFVIREGLTTQKVLGVVQNFFSDLPFRDLPPSVAARLLSEAAVDERFLAAVGNGEDASSRLSQLLHVAVVRAHVEKVKKAKDTGTRESSRVAVLESYCAELLAGESPALVAALRDAGDFATYERNIIEGALGSLQDEE